MDVNFIIIIFLIGAAGSFISGMLGIGGAIINYPMLYYIPALLGATQFTAHEVSGITAVQVFFGTVGGILAYRNSGYLNKKLIGIMGGSILLGSLAGGFGSSHMPENGINLVYGILALLAVILMFLPRRGIDDISLNDVQFNKLLAAALSFLVGVGAGIVGAGGSFLLMPVMLVILRIPTRMAIASSLAITMISSAGTIFTKVVTGQVSYVPAVILVLASLAAAPLGAKLGRRMNTKVLQIMMGVLILATAIKIWLGIL